MKGSEANDSFYMDADRCAPKQITTEASTGVLPMGCRLFSGNFKATSSIFLVQDTIDIKNGKRKTELKGRHDTCIVPRAVPLWRRPAPSLCVICI